MKIPLSTLRPIVCSPMEEELIQCVIKAACQLYSIQEAQLLSDQSPAVANIRFMCYWIIANNTGLKDYMIASFFSKSRTAVRYGVGLIDFRKGCGGIYRQTLDDLRNIASIADNFTKKHPWDIQLISTTSS